MSDEQRIGVSKRQLRPRCALPTSPLRDCGRRLWRGVRLRGASQRCVHSPDRMAAGSIRVAAHPFERYADVARLWRLESSGGGESDADPSGPRPLAAKNKKKLKGRPGSPRQPQHEQPHDHTAPATERGRGCGAVCRSFVCAE